MLPRFGEGGPAWYNGKNKTFFFFNYGGYRTFQSETVDLTVPTVRMRQGDFWELLTDPYVRSFQFATPAAIPGRTASRFSTRASRRVSARRFRATASTCTRAARSSPPSGEHRQPLPAAEPDRPPWLDRLPQLPRDDPSRRQDELLRDEDHAHAHRPAAAQLQLHVPQAAEHQGRLPALPRALRRVGVWDQLFKSYYARLQHDWTLTPTLLNHFNAGFSRSDVSNRNFTAGVGTASELGFAPGATQDFGLPLVGFPGYGDPVTSTRPARLPGRRLHLLQQPRPRQLGPHQRFRDPHPRPALDEVRRRGSHPAVEQRRALRHRRPVQLPQQPDGQHQRLLAGLADREPDHGPAGVLLQQQPDD